MFPHHGPTHDVKSLYALHAHVTEPPPSRFSRKIVKQSLTLGICYQLFGKPVCRSRKRFTRSSFPKKIVFFCTPEEHSSTAMGGLTDTTQPCSEGATLVRPDAPMGMPATASLYGGLLRRPLIIENAHSDGNRRGQSSPPA